MYHNFRTKHFYKIGNSNSMPTLHRFHYMVSVFWGSGVIGGIQGSK